MILVLRMNPGHDRHRNGLVLCGGGAKGAYQVGVWKALCELGIQFDVLSGTSIGAFNAALFATKEIPNVERFWLSLSAAKLRPLLKCRFRWFLNLIPPGIWESYFDSLITLFHLLPAIRGKRQPPRSRDGYEAESAARRAAAFGRQAVFWLILVTVFLWFVLGRYPSFREQMIAFLVLTASVSILHVSVDRPRSLFSAAALEHLCSGIDFARLRSSERQVFAAIGRKALKLSETAAETSAIMRKVVELSKLAEAEQLLGEHLPRFRSETGRLVSERERASGSLLFSSPHNPRAIRIPDYVLLNKEADETACAALQASMALPWGLFDRVRVSHDDFVDGVIADNTPVYPALTYGCDHIYLVHLKKKGKQLSTPEKIELHLFKIDTQRRWAGYESLFEERARKGAQKDLRYTSRIHFVHLVPSRRLCFPLVGNLWFSARKTRRLIDLGYADTLTALTGQRPS